jgi:Fe-Mn family superoxide dismutase
MPFQQLPLPYDFAALEPHIDAATMELHYMKHHAKYVQSLNEALEKHPDLYERDLEELLRNLDTLPSNLRTAVRNHGGGHLNHTLFWQIMTPQGGGVAVGPALDALEKDFRSFSNFRKKFVAAGMKHFGSGWVWLVLRQDGALAILTTPNQDSPIMKGHYPIFGNDLWEHAYYLKYQSRRQDYLEAWWNVLNWPEINRRFEQSRSAGGRLEALPGGRLPAAQKEEESAVPAKRHGTGGG